MTTKQIRCDLARGENRGMFDEIRDTGLRVAGCGMLVCAVTGFYFLYESIEFAA